MVHRAPTTVRPLLIALCLLLPAARLPAATPLGYKPHKQGRFIMALARRPDGVVFVGTEDHGIWAFHPTRAKSRRWTHFTTADGLGDNHIYALAVDHRGRVWAGHLNHGVSVYNGKTWRNYDRTTGPLGERVFDIAVAPAPPGSAPAPGSASGGASGGGGDVWIATDAGLTRYDPAEDTWSYLTRADGLPSNQIEAIAFGPRGTLYAATQCHGLAICHPSKPRTRWSSPRTPGRAARGRSKNTEPMTYQNWRVVASQYEYPLSIAPAGSGLPTNLLNDVLVAHNGDVWLATDAGLAWSHDHGRTFHYIRGKNWKTKAQGLYHPPSKSRIAAAARKINAKLLLSEDYVTRLAEDSRGLIWMGHRDLGVEVLDPRTGKRFRSDGKPLSHWAAHHSKTPRQRPSKNGKQKPVPPARQDYVSALLLIPGQRPLAGFYRQGLIQLPNGFTSPALTQPIHNAKDTPTEVASLPSPRSLSLVQLRSLVARLHHPTADSGKDSHTPDRAQVVRLLPDWRTEGTWIGRYGTIKGICAAQTAPNDNVTGSYWGAMFAYTIRIGKHADKDDAARYWVQWLHTKNPKSLQNKLQGGRRQSSWDDHGEAYPRDFQGPDLYINLKAPPGVWRLSLYFFNKDGHGGANRIRDFVISIRDYSKTDKAFSHRPELARARVHNFWGGVWKRFQIRGGRSYTIRIAKNGSYDTICSGLFIDPIINPHPLFHYKREFIFRKPNGDPDAVDPVTIDISGLTNAVQPWLKAMDQLKALRDFRLDDDLPRRRLVYLTAAARLHEELNHPHKGHAGIRYAVVIRRRLADCFARTLQYHQRDRMNQQIENMWPLLP